MQLQLRHLQYLHRVQGKGTLIFFSCFFSKDVPDFMILGRSLPQLSFNTLAFKWLPTLKLCPYTMSWNAARQNSGWTLQLLNCILFSHTHTLHFNGHFYFIQSVKCWLIVVINIYEIYTQNMHLRCILLIKLVSCSACHNLTVGMCCLWMSEWLDLYKQSVYFIVVYLYVISLHAKLCSVLYSPLSVCMFVCLFVGPPYYSQRAVFASPRSTFHYPRRARSALGVDTVLTLDVCMFVCMLGL